MGVGFGRGHATGGAGSGRSWLGDAVRVSELCLSSIVHSSFPRPRWLGLPGGLRAAPSSQVMCQPWVLTSHETRPEVRADGSVPKTAIDMPEWRGSWQRGESPVASSAQRRASAPGDDPVVSSFRRSEERRGGKESRSRWARYKEKKK